MANKKRNPWMTCFIVLAVFICLTVCCVTVIGAGGYYAFNAGMLNQREVLNAVGMGT
ncbi:MAG: hypothetical protein HN916_04580, partial [Anaerolineae bacterium]|nr:hypothetical protein [Anaerolineae bacterium]